MYMLYNILYLNASTIKTTVKNGRNRSHSQLYHVRSTIIASTYNTKGVLNLENFTKICKNKNTDRTQIYSKNCQIL